MFHDPHDAHLRPLQPPAQNLGVATPQHTGIDAYASDKVLGVKLSTTLCRNWSL